jgi:serine/threonine-protein kinase
VAVKVLTRTSAEGVARFQRELRIQAELAEAGGFVPILDAGESPSGPYLVMPMLQGGTLRSRLTGVPWPVHDVIELGITLAEALGRAHAAGFIHRDLKPDNVLYDGAGRALIADLGLAKQRGDARSLGLSRSLSLSGELRGTAGYMAPEQMRDAKRVSPAADVFALGALLYEAATAAPAFPGENPLQVIERVESGSHLPAHRARPGLPHALAEVLEGCLQREASKRYADGAALALALRAAQGGGGRRRARAPPRSARTRAWARSPSHRRSPPAPRARPALRGRRLRGRRRRTRSRRKRRGEAPARRRPPRWAEPWWWIAS